MQKSIPAAMQLLVETILMKGKELDRVASVIGYLVIGNGRNPQLSGGFATSAQAMEML